MLHMSPIYADPIAYSHTDKHMLVSLLETVQLVPIDGRYSTWNRSDLEN